jgi:MoxR-like ATPase
MTFHQFKGSGPIPQWRASGNGATASLTDPEGYQASEALVHAVNVALALKMPLLLTGEPGTGKTQLAYRLAAERGLGTPARFDTKSSSQANDLFFSFDSVRHFAQSQLRAALKQALPDAREFIRFDGLGEAIIRTHSPGAVADLLPEGFPPYTPGQTVVLIDEIDKAPRDFPNDLLNQLENLEFAVPELRKEKVSADKEYPPIVVITSNSEKQLPDPFLRRCIYHHIALSPDRITAIVSGRLRDLPLKAPAFESAQQFFFSLRQREAGLAKIPSLSEDLDWLRALARAGLSGTTPLAPQLHIAKGCLGALVKTGPDLAIAEDLLARIAA